MDQSKDANPDISQFESLLDHNWNERKHLVESEFALRVEIQSLVQQKDSLEKHEEARGRDRANRAALTRNNDEHDSLIEKWAEETFGVDL